MAFNYLDDMLSVAETKAVPVNKHEDGDNACVEGPDMNTRQMGSNMGDLFHTPNLFPLLLKWHPMIRSSHTLSKRQLAPET